MYWRLFLRSARMASKSGSVLRTLNIRNTARLAGTNVTKDSKDLKSSYDVVIIGAGHNGLVAAAYLQKAGKSVCVLERRHVIGGAAVTEEIVPGFKFSRASYVLSLLRPFIISDLKLKENGLKFHLREPYSSFTPISESKWSQFPAKYLLLSGDLEKSVAEISKFSKKDAQKYGDYEEQMGKYVKAINILLDNRPPNLHGRFSLEKIQSLGPILRAALAVGKDVSGFHEILTASAEKILNKWFTSEPLKATLATDALIGNMAGPKSAGTGYVLLHHCMGGVDGKAGAWAYPEGGMGAVSQAIGSSAAQLGASIFTNKEVHQVKLDRSAGHPTATSVVLKTCEEIKASAIFSGATPEVTFKKLFQNHSPQEREEIFGSEFIKAIDQFDYTSPVTKINVAVSRLPNFIAKPNTGETVQDLHKCTIHLNSESMDQLHSSYASAAYQRVPSDRPMIEMVIPSSVDKTIAPIGAHVCLLFTQFTPISPSNGSWSDPNFKQSYANKVFDIIEEYAPGFKASIVGTDVLTPWDLQQTFGLTGGNIFHGSMSLDQLFWLRPASSKSSWFPATPISNFYLCGSGAHPGGGVMGLPGYLAAKTFLNSG